MKRTKRREFVMNEKEASELSDKDKKASERFWELDKLIRLDKKNPGVLLELRKSNTVIDIMRLLRNDVISLEDLKDFSEELREAVATYKE